MAKASVKDQQELAGIERPSSKEMDARCAAVMKAERKEKEWKDKAKSAREDVKIYLKENRDEFEKDKNDDPVYAYVDGVKEKVFRLKKSEDLTITDAKKSKPDLSIVELEDE